MRRLGRADNYDGTARKDTRLRPWQTEVHGKAGIGYSAQVYFDLRESSRSRCRSRNERTESWRRDINGSLKLGKCYNRCRKEHGMVRLRLHGRGRKRCLRDE